MFREVTGSPTNFSGYAEGEQMQGPPTTLWDCGLERVPDGARVSKERVWPEPLCAEFKKIVNAHLENPGDKPLQMLNLLDSGVIDYEMVKRNFWKSWIEYRPLAGPAVSCLEVCSQRRTM